MLIIEDIIFAFFVVYAIFTVLDVLEFWIFSCVKIIWDQI